LGLLTYYAINLGYIRWPEIGREMEIYKVLGRFVRNKPQISPRVRVQNIPCARAYYEYVWTTSSSYALADGLLTTMERSP